MRGIGRRSSKAHAENTRQLPAAHNDGSSTRNIQENRDVIQTGKLKVRKGLFSTFSAQIIYCGLIVILVMYDDDTWFDL